VPTTPYIPAEGTTAHSVLTSHNTPTRQVGPLYKRAMGVYERADGRQMELAQTLNNFGVFLKQQGELTMAEEMYRRTLAIHEKVRALLAMS
jgi:hypothetical protein